MTGITNHDPGEEAANQQIVRERTADQLPAERRGKKDHPVGKDREAEIESRDRIHETGVGRGTQHQGH